MDGLNKILKLLGKKYIIESGVDANGWDYEKWSDGTYVASCSRLLSATIASASGSLYQSGGVPVPYPTIATKANLTKILITGYNTGANSDTNGMYNSYIQRVTDTEIAYRNISSISNGTNSVSMKTTIRIEGTWQ